MVFGRLLYQLHLLMEYKVAPNFNHPLYTSDLENSVLVILEKGIQNPEDYYRILSYMLEIKDTSISCELYKDEKTKLYKTRNVVMNPNYILDNETKLHQWLISNTNYELKWA